MRVGESVITRNYFFVMSLNVSHLSKLGTIVNIIFLSEVLCSTGGASYTRTPEIATSN
jgi:hypothetical protein